MLNQTIGIKIKDASVLQEVLYNEDDSIKQIRHTLTVKSELSLEVEGFVMVKEISNSVLIDNEMILDLIRQKNNFSVLTDFIRKKQE